MYEVAKTTGGSNGIHGRIHKRHRRQIGSIYELCIGIYMCTTNDEERKKMNGRDSRG